MRNLDGYAILFYVGLVIVMAYHILKWVFL